MNAPIYQDYLNGVDWKKLKLRYRASGLPWRCRICQTTQDLNLHHRTYETLGQENIYQDVIPLCTTHHARVHWDEKKGLKTPLDYRHLYQREKKLYRQYNSLLSKIGRYRLGSLIDKLWKNYRDSWY